MFGLPCSFVSTRNHVDIAFLSESACVKAPTLCLPRQACRDAAVWLGAVLLGAALCLPSWALSVVFINPGKTDEAYWLAAGQSMQVSATSLGMDLEVQYAERNHLRALELARALVARPKDKRPDYAVFSNDYATGAAVLQTLEGSGIKSFMAFSRLTKEEEAQHGTARKKFKDWIGSLEPIAEDAGYLTAKALIAQGRSKRLHASDGKLHLLAVAGDRSTTSSGDDFWALSAETRKTKVIVLAVMANTCRHPKSAFWCRS